LGDLDIGIISGSGLVGDSIPVAVGAALACQCQGTDRVVEVFFGDAASNRGDFHEGLNLAAVWKAPIIFICENNHYGWSLHISKQMAIDDIADRAQGYGFPGVVVDGNDVIDVYEKTQTAIQRARAGEGPTLLECKTYRWRGHSEREAMEYRPPEEIEAWKAKCPIKRLSRKLMDDGALTEAEIEQIDQEVLEEIQAAVEYAEQAPLPEPHETLEDVYAPYEVEA
jgi:pyruvate dehydrogenase E1 component alpha subunit